MIMRNVKCLVAAILMLILAMSLCACGGEAEAPTTEAPVVEAPVVTEAPAQETEAPAEEEDGYTVTVLDEAGNPVAGAMVQMCKDACVPGITDAEGVAKFNLPEDTYKVSFLALPAGYTYVDETDTFYFKDGVLTLDVPESDYMGGRIVNPGKWDTDKGFAQVVTGVELVKDLGADNPDNNIVFAEPGNYTVTVNGSEISIVKN